MALSSMVHILPSSEPTELLSKVAEKRKGLNYCGDVAPEDAYDFLKIHQGVIVDVRTPPEWQFVGVPDLAGTKGKLATVSWKNYPDFSPNTQFSYEMHTISGVNKETPLLFICRSGGRSLDAALAMTQAGYRYCFNIEGGFEGEPDAKGHRGTGQGWKARQLPWKQG